MAVAAEQTEIFQAIIAVITINVVKFKRYWMAAPLSDAAIAAHSSKHAARYHIVGCNTLFVLEIKTISSWSKGSSSFPASSDIVSCVET